MKRLASVIVCLAISLTACTGAGGDSRPNRRSAPVASAASAAPTPPGVITKAQLTRLGQDIASARSRKEQDFILASAQFAFYNCTFTAVYVSESFQGVLAECGGQHFTTGGERAR